MAGIKTRHSDVLLRAVEGVRESMNTRDEFKFTRIKPENEHRYLRIVDLLHRSDAQVHGLVVDRSAWNPFRGQGSEWAAHAALAGRIVITGMNSNEIATVFLDGITTPPDVALGALVKRHVNREVGAKVVTAVSLNSKTNDLLQLADLVAGSIRALRFNQIDPSTPTGAAKQHVALRLLLGFGMTRFDQDCLESRCRVRLALPSASRRDGT